jgi:hypothetical protein
MPRKLIGSLCLVIILGAGVAKAQNLEEIGVHKGVKVNGSLNMNTIGYWAHGIEQRRDPFNWFFTGNLNVNLFGYDTPFSFSYSNANRSFSQPFNQFSFSPQYKWVKTYIGYSAMTFSNYTLAGHVFLGGGVELTPGKWRVSAMGGRLRKAVQYNLSDTLQFQEAAYRRMGYGAKVGYEDNGDMISASIFTARDELQSLPFVLPESQISPQQNVAISFSGRKQIFKRVFAEAEYAVSALNNDIRANREDSLTAAPSKNLVKGLLPENATSRYYDALNAGIGYQGNWYTIQAKYERVAPEYQTLGAYFFNNDMENMTLAPSVRLFKNTLNLSTNAGLQRNNLDATRAATNKRMVGSFSSTYVPNEHWNLMLSYSNFTSYTNIRPQADPFFQNQLDTLNFYQVNQTMNGAIGHNFGKQDAPQSLMFNASYQLANDRASYMEGGQLSDFVNLNMAYSYVLTPLNTSFSIAGNYFTNNAAGMKSTMWGPSISLNRSFMEKTLRASVSSAYNQASGGGVQAAPVLNNRLSLAYAPKGKSEKSNHSTSLGLNALRRFKGASQQAAYTELTAMLNYTYSF